MRLSATGVPSSRVQPSPRTWRTTSVSTAPGPDSRSSAKASACCCAALGQGCSGRGLRLERITMRGQQGDERACDQGLEPQGEQHHAISFGAPLDAALTKLVLFELFGVRVVAHPKCDCTAKLGRRHRASDSHEFYLVVGRGDAGEGADLRIGDCPAANASAMAGSSKACGRFGSILGRCRSRHRRCGRASARPWVSRR